MADLCALFICSNSKSEELHVFLSVSDFRSVDKNGTLLPRFLFVIFFFPLFPVWCQSLTLVLCPFPPSGGSGPSVSALVFLCGKQGSLCAVKSSPLLGTTWDFDILLKPEQFSNILVQLDAL